MLAYAVPVATVEGDVSTSGKRIAAARTTLGLTQTQLAVRIKSTRGTIAVWETKDRVPEGDVLLRLAQALNVNPAWLMMMSENCIKPEELTPDESKMLHTFRKLSQDHQDQIVSQMEFLMGRQDDRPPRTVSRGSTRLTPKPTK